MLLLLPGGISTRRSGLRLFIPKFIGGGDFACIFLFKLPGETSRPGELRGFPYPFPVKVKTRGEKKERDKSSEVHCIFYALLKLWNKKLRIDIYVMYLYRKIQHVLYLEQLVFKCFLSWQLTSLWCPEINLIIQFCLQHCGI